MRATRFTREALAYRREQRDMLAAGWEPVGESGGMLWELNRGYRMSHRIVDVRIGACGKRLWVKIEPPAGLAALASHENGESR